MMPAGEAVTPAAILGQTALKSGQSKALSRLPNMGTEWARAHHKAEKKAPKNITSEKMNQLMLQRNERSILRPYRPDSLSETAALNHLKRMNNQITMPASKEYLPQAMSLTQKVAPKMTKNNPREVKAGNGEGSGT